MQATIIMVSDGYTVAETVARALASQQGFLWHKVAVVSR
jgi:hypothetical protein